MRLKQDADLWFRRKKYGWGWTPATREGWYVTAGAVVAIGLSALYFEDRPDIGMAVIALIIGILLIICYRKGEPPKWSWG
jgi:hypothetical protein